MADKKERETTRRAYTLRLSGLSPTDTEWRDALWQTHEAVNKGAKVFGDWLLTLRGGLDHNLVNFADSKGKESSEPTEEERRSRRILLALSWLSVESERGAPEEFKVEQQEVVEVFKKILAARGVGPDEVEVWVKDCSPSLKAAIRDDAVWVNRSGVFDSIYNEFAKGDSREDARKLLWAIFDQYLTWPRSEKPEKNSAEDPQATEVESISALAGSGSTGFGTGAGKKTRSVFGYIFGKKDKLDLKNRTIWKDHLTRLIKCDSGLPLEHGDTRTELHREMFSKAASRLAQILTKQKQQEVERFQARGEEVKDTERKKADKRYADACNLLDKYCDRRAVDSGALEGYRINPKAISSWEKVLSSWGGLSHQQDNEEGRKKKLAQLQDEERDGKFGDINLFKELAAKKYEILWKNECRSSRSYLPDYVKSAEAKFKARSLKVPSYRHPDPFFNPVFCEFGTSRPQIKFARLGQKLDDEKNVKGSDYCIQLLLKYDGSARPLILSAHSKRFNREISSKQHREREPSGSIVCVARMSRLGQAAGTIVNQDEPRDYRIAGVFDKKSKKKRKRKEGDEVTKKKSQEKPEDIETDPSWNGRLTAPRYNLTRIGTFLLEKSEPARAKAEKEKLKWYVTVSLELTKDDNKMIERVAQGEKQKNSHAVKYSLSRRPGLRILSVDLGHRHAAACAVWEVMNREQIEEACRDCGFDAPTEQHLFLHLKGELKKKNKKGEEVEVAKTTIYRRIGADTIEDGQPHPGPWARLDRQFLIKLQGEERGVRKASNEEVECIDEIKKELGRQQQSNEKSAAVDEVMFSAVSTLRNAMKRHGDRARIAFAINSNYQVMPGGQKYYFDESKELSIDDDAEKRRERHIAFIQDMLICWRSLLSTEGWQDDEAREAWDRFIKPLLGDVEIKEGSTNISRAQRRKEQEQVREKLKPAATALIDDLALRDCIYKSWSEQWEDKDVQLRRHIKTISRMILPRSKKTKDPTNRKVGGLSLTRIATLTEFRRKVQVGFFTRLRPDGTREEAKEGFGQRTLDALERLRDQRVKQLASRIVEAALGIGRMAHTSGTKDQKRPVSQVDKVCHAVVVENLKNYRPKETRSRRENRQLAEWSSSRIAKYLGEACELHGLGYKEVSAAYTSQQDSRTGAPGIRCQDVPTTEKNTFWKNQVTEAEKKDTFRSRYIEDLHQKFKKMSDKDRSKHPFVRIPQRGGDIFVSAESTSSAAKGIQADLNAAANIGLKALVDPEFVGAWWFVPCDQKGYPVKDKVKGYQIIKTDESLLPEKSEDGPRDSSVSKKRSKGSAEKAEKRIINLWCDISATDCHSRSRSWLPYEDYWSKGEKSVESRVVKILRDQSKVLKNELNGRSEDEEMPF